MEKNIGLNNKYMFRRGFAYLIDIFLVLFITSMISQMNFINPTKEKYDEIYNEYSELYENQEDIKSLTNSSEYKEIMYKLSKYGIVYIVIDAAVLIGYFVFFQKATNGQTVGKKLMKIRIVSNNNSDVKLWQLLVRSLFIFSIITDIIFSITVYFAPQNIYYYVNLIGTSIFNVLFYVSIIMALFKPDGRGLHDVIAKTKVIDLKENIPNETIVEAKIEDSKLESNNSKQSKKPVTKKITKQKTK